MLRVCLLIACCWLTPLAVAAETPPCVQANVARASARVRALLAANNVRGEDLGSHGAGGTATKNSSPDALVAYMRAVASCVPAGADAHSIAGELTEHLAVADSAAGGPGLPVLPRPKTAAEFEDDPFAVHFLVADTRVAAGASRHVAMLASYGPACGRQGELTVFSQSGADGWRQDFAWAAPPFSLVASQPASAQLAIGPDGDGAPWYVTFAAREPACKQQATDWVRLTVLTPGSGSARAQAAPEIALRDEFLADASNANPADWMRMTAEPGLLDVEFNGIHDASKQEIFAGRRTYRIAGGRAHRIEPVAFTPVEFIEIWLAAPWRDALSWTEQSDHAQADSLRQAHEELTGSSGNSGNTAALPETSSEKRRCCALFEAVYRCDGSAQKRVEDAGRTEVVAQYPAYEQLGGDGRRYFLLRVVGSGFVMERVGSQPDGTCGGANLLRQTDAAQ